MNISIITARLLADPERFYSFGNYITEVKVSFLHVKNYLAHAIILADNKTGQEIMEFYSQGDYVLIEGECITVEDKYQNSFPIIYAADVQPARLIIEE